MQQDKSLVCHPGAPTSLDLHGRQVAVIGGTGGIGQALSRALASRGASVRVVGQTFRDAGTAGIEFMPADLSLMQEARRVAAQLPAENLDLLIFTTGIFAAPERQETAEGIERDMAVSYLSRLVILRAIASRLGTSRSSTACKPRVFLMGYPGSGQLGNYADLNAERSYKAMPVHMNTVAGNEMLVLDAARRYPYLNVYGLNPGLIKTNIRDNFFGQGSLKSRLAEALIGALTPSAEAYAQRMVPLLVSPDIEGHSGALFNRKGQAIRPTPGLTDEHIEKFMFASAALVARAGISLKAA